MRYQRERAEWLADPVWSQKYEVIEHRPLDEEGDIVPLPLDIPLPLPAAPVVDPNELWLQRMESNLLVYTYAPHEHALDKGTHPLFIDPIEALATAKVTPQASVNLQPGPTQPGVLVPSPKRVSNRDGPSVERLRPAGAVVSQGTAPHQIQSLTLHAIPGCRGSHHIWCRIRLRL